MTNTLTPAERSNQAHWDEIAPVHVKAHNAVAILKAGGIALDEIELREVGDVTGKTLLHLQCHIGTDTLSAGWYHYPQYAGKLPWIFTLTARKP